MSDAILYNKVRAKGWLLLMLSAAMLSACSADGDKTDGTGEGDVLQLSAYMQTMTEQTDADTRAGLDGYSPYSGPNTIAVYMSTKGMTASDQLLPSTFYYEGDAWHSLVNVRVGTDYYIYGFMPGNIDANYSITPAADGYDKGAVIAFDNLSPVSAGDFCVLTGVLWTGAKATPSDIPSGQFAYQGKEKGSNFVNLKFEHAYAGIRFRLKVGEEYSKLRTIKLKELSLRTTSTYSVKWSLQFNQGNATTPVSFPNPERTPLTGSSFVTLFSDDDGEQLYTTTAKDILGYYFPVAYYYIGRELQIRCRYDVYDTKGNLLRRDCEATNDLPDMTANRGTMRTLNLTIEPTYLYVLSDPDLDNPTVKVRSDE